MKDAAKRHHYSTLDVGRSMLDVHFHINGCPAYRAAGGAQGRAAVGSPAIRETGAQARPGIPVLAGRRPCGDYLQRGCDAGKTGLYSPEPGEAGIREHPRALAVFERAELPRRAGADRDRPLVLGRRDAGASRAAFPRWSVQGCIPTLERGNDPLNNTMRY